MSIQLTYKQLRNINGHRELMGKLVHTPFPGKMAYDLKKIIEDLAKQGEIIQEEHRLLMEGFYKRDEKGELLKNSEGAYELKEGCDVDLQKVLTDFDEKTFSIERSPIPKEPLLAIKKFEISVSELTALEPICIERPEGMAQVTPLKIS